MMQWMLSIRLSVVLCLMAIHVDVNAGSSPLFTVSSSGLNLSISSTRINHTYPAAGIKINTPDYSLANGGVDCSPASNGYCLFAVNNTKPTSLSIKGPANGLLNLSLCLNGKGPLSCQTYDVSLKQLRAQWIIVSDINTNKVLTFPADSNGNVSPTYTLSGNNTGISTPYGLYLDADSNKLWVSNFSTGNVSQFNLPADGNQTPSTLGGVNTTLLGPTGAGTDSAGNFYVADYTNNSVDVFPPGSTGDTAPSRTIKSSPANLTPTYLDTPGSIGVTPSGDVFVANSAQAYFNPTLLKFLPGAGVNASPSKTYAFPSGATPGGLWIASSGNIWVTDSNINDNTAQEFHPNADSTFSLLRTIAGSNTQLVQPYGIATDLAGYIYVACQNGGSNGYILVFDPSATGNVAPIQTIGGNLTTLVAPVGLTIQQ